MKAHPPGTKVYTLPVIFEVELMSDSATLAGVQDVEEGPLA